MAKILIDSCVYLSIFLGDSEYDQAIELVTPYLDDPDCTIYLPTIVIAEVVNTLSKSNTKEKELDDFIAVVISSSKYIIVETDLIFHFKNIRNNASQVKLKTNDLIIFSIAKKYKLDSILTIDKQLSNTKL